MHCSEKISLLLEFIGSLLMGTDYLLNVRQRRHLRILAQKIADSISAGLSSDITERVALLRERVHLLLAAFLMAGIAALVGAIAFFVRIIDPLIFAALFLTIVFFASAPLAVICANAFAMFPAVVRLVPLSAIKILGACPKGIVAGIGFAFLIASFVCKYTLLP